MTLIEYLTATQTDARQLAVTAGVAWSTMERLVLGGKPRVDTARRIESATCGQVRMEDWADAR